jgi:hypothetical protein
LPFAQSITTDAKTLQTELKTDGKEKQTKKRKKKNNNYLLTVLYIQNVCGVCYPYVIMH